MPSAPVSKPALYRHDPDMPLRARIKDFLSVKKKSRRASRETSTSKSGTATPHTGDENTTPVHAEQAAETQLTDPIPLDRSVVEVTAVENPDKAKPEALSPHDSGDADDGGASKTLMAIDAAIEVASILKEASEASSILIPLKVASTAILKILETARVRSHSPGPPHDLKTCRISGEVDFRHRL
jgi:hypothetical protein